MKEIRMAQGMELIPPKPIDPAELEAIRQGVAVVLREMFKRREAQKRRWIGPEFYTPLK